jgi:CRISPR-associated protein (TIGR02584 family)
MAPVTRGSSGDAGATHDARRNILLCVAGYTPAVITETLWGLTQEHGLRVDEVRVITTLDGRELIRERLWRGGLFEAFRTDYPACRGVRFDESSLHLLTRNKDKAPSEFDPDSERLKDVVSTEDNECAANQICEVVRQLTLGNTRVHASVAGGRKSMGIYLTVAMQLFGRADDTLSHVLVDRGLEVPGFYYPGPGSYDPGSEDFAARAGVNLAFIPYLRLRGVARGPALEDGVRFGDRVGQLQRELNARESNAPVELDLKGRTVSAGDRAAVLTPKHFFLYLLFALLKAGGEGDGFVALEELAMPHFNEAFRALTRARGRETGYKDFTGNMHLVMDAELNAVHRTIGMLLDKKAGGGGDALEDYMKNLRAAITHLNKSDKKSLGAQGIPARYHIVARRSYGDTRYGLDLPAEQIIIR